MVVVSGNKALQLHFSNLSSGQGCFWNVWKVHMRWVQCVIIYLSLMKLLQLLSQWSQHQPAWCVAEPWELTQWGGMPWPPVDIIYLRPLHSYPKFTAEGQEWWSWISYSSTITQLFQVCTACRVVPRPMFHLKEQYSVFNFGRWEFLIT